MYFGHALQNHLPKPKQVGVEFHHILLAVLQARTHCVHAAACTEGDIFKHKAAIGSHPVERLTAVVGAHDEALSF